MDKLEKIKWVVNNQNPCTKCGHSSYCCGCPAHTEWVSKFDSLNIDDATYEEARSVKMVLSLKKDLEKRMSNISEEVKKAFML